MCTSYQQNILNGKEHDLDFLVLPRYYQAYEFADIFLPVLVLEC